MRQLIFQKSSDLVLTHTADLLSRMVAFLHALLTIIPLLKIFRVKFCGLSESS